MFDSIKAIQNAIFSLDGEGVLSRRDNDTPQNLQAQNYLEASFAANIPSWPLSDPFVQAANYKDTIYLAIQHLMQAMSSASVGLERKAEGKKGMIAQGGGQATDQGYEPFTDHPLADIITRPNPSDTFADFVCQCVLNWNLHGRILIWARPNAVGAPIRYYCLPIPLCVPAFPVGSQRYPLGAWMIQQYYPTTGIAGILPTGLVGSAGAIIDSREVYDMKNPHPVYRWAPYSPLVGGDSAIDNIQNIDLSFWSIMSQGFKPAGFIDAPGADGNAITAIQNKLDNSHGGARKHGRPVVLGGGDPDRPALKWNALGGLIPDALHEGGWEIYTSFVLALFGLDMAGVGLRRSGGFAERWAARRDERDTLTTFLNKLAALLTQGGLVKQWGLLKQGVRVVINLPEIVGYEPAEMSRDMSGDSSGTYNEVRRLRGYKAGDGVMAEEHNGKAIGDYPYAIAIQLANKKLGLDDVTQQKQLSEQNAKLQQQQQTQEQANNPDNNRPDTPEGAKGALGGEGNGAPKPGATEVKGIVDWKDRGLPPREDLAVLVRRVLSAPVSLNGLHHG